VQPHRFYKSKQWQRLRTVQLANHPWCAFCLAVGVQTKADTVDHITPHRGDANLFFRGALQSLCHACHSSTKQHHERSRSVGHDINGYPRDPNHPSYRRPRVG